MSSQNMSKNMQNLFEKVLDNCGRRDTRQTNSALNDLIRYSDRSNLRMPVYGQLYRLCLMYSNLKRFGDIQAAFDRLSSRWMAALMALTARHKAIQIRDVEIEHISDEMLCFRTQDSVIARRLQNIRGARLDSIEHCQSGEYLWNINIKEIHLPRVLSTLRKPKYMEFLDNKYSEQLSIEF